MRKQSAPKLQWPWIVVLGLAVVVLIAAGVGFLSQEEDDAAPVERIQVRPVSDTMTQQEMHERILAIRAREPEDPEFDTEQTIERYRARVEADPDDAESPALFHAMGNLYRHRLMDYENAAWSYQQIILRYPDWEGLPSVYADLATCYELLGDHDNVLRTYMEMMRVLPKDTQEYLYAKEKLGL